MGFESLSTVIFQKKMRPFAIEIYQKIFPGCLVCDLREDGHKVHILDKHFGIDSIATLDSGQWFSIQEKYRKHDYLKYLDFTQEYKNGEGTKFEENGEWFHLGAQLYFYGWANQEETGFEKWALIDIARYKLLVESAGGLSKIGEKMVNRTHGRASFFCIPINRLKESFVKTYKDFI